MTTDTLRASLRDRIATADADAASTADTLRAILALIDGTAQ